MRLNQKTKAKQLKPTHLAFVSMHRSGLDMWCKMPNHRVGITAFKPAETRYISVYELKEKARRLETGAREEWRAPTIWQGMPGFMCTSWVNEYSKKEETNYRFSTGGYYDSDKALLVDDVIEWTHHRREAKDVRSAWDIMTAIKRGELEL